jgi:hypothetical protein
MYLLSRLLVTCPNPSSAPGVDGVQAQLSVPTLAMPFLVASSLLSLKKETWDADSSHISTCATGYYIIERKIFLPDSGLRRDRRVSVAF